MASDSQSQDLVAASWEAIGYKNDQQTVASVLAGATLTAVFRKEGTLSGSRGCNTFGSPCTVGGNPVAIGRLAST